ncbi:hypothetical protein RJ639_027176 [Escallonia herrerae]|uniref:F-box domain-containing protein n=1 Tax=Escallonia herrerae TaxID=1293975 RepID=A0AA88X5M5_9ASTE|nr:hypothetical protein RJ639_027176 [Escallonia herrerae]
MERSLLLCRYPKAVGAIEDLWIEEYRYKLREERLLAARKKEQEDKEDDQADQPITLPGLPGEFVVSEIVSRLPARSLSRFRCVCKLWRSLLANPALMRTMPNVRHKVLIQSIGDRFYSIDYEASDWNVVPLDFPTHEIGQPYYNPSVSSVGSCNGWVCVDIHRRASESTILVWNPLTGHYKRIPDSCRDPSYRRDIGFGYDSCADDYFVVRMYTKRIISVDVYMLKRDSWEKIEVVPGLIDPNDFAVRDLAVNGSVVYILVNGMDKLASFDLKGGKFRDVPFPDDLRGAEGQLGLDVLEGCLAVVEWSREKPQGQVWQLKQESSNTTPMKQVWVKHSELTLASTFDVQFRFARDGKVVGLSRLPRIIYLQPGPPLPRPKYSATGDVVKMDYGGAGIYKDANLAISHGSSALSYLAVTNKVTKPATKNKGEKPLHAEKDSVPKQGRDKSCNRRQQRGVVTYAEEDNVPEQGKYLPHAGNDDDLVLPLNLFPLKPAKANKGKEPIHAEKNSVPEQSKYLPHGGEDDDLVLPLNLSRLEPTTRDEDNKPLHAENKRFFAQGNYFANDYRPMMMMDSIELEIRASRESQINSQERAYKGELLHAQKDNVPEQRKYLPHGGKHDNPVLLLTFLSGN